jgi:hypothetical protein
MVNKNLVSLVIVITLFPFTASAASFSEISSFAENICDKLSTTGSIERTKILGSLNGNAKALIKLIGGSIGLDGSVIIDNVSYDGFSHDMLPAQMSDARACRKELALVLLAKRDVIQNIKVSNIKKVAKFKLSRKGFDISLMQIPDFKSLTNPMSSENKITNIIEGTKIDLLDGQHAEDINGAEVVWRKVRLSSGGRAGLIGWVPQNNIEEL